jgi:hypothetical protein
MALLAHSHCSKMNAFETTRSGFSADCFFRDTFKNWNPPFFIGKTHGFRCSDLAQAKTIKNHQKPAVELLDLPFFFRSGPLAAECARCGSQSFLAAHGSTVASGFLLKKRAVSQKKLVVFRGLQSYQSLSLVICWMVELGSLGTGLNSIQKKQTLLVDSSVEPSGRWDQLCSWRLFMLRKGAETAESIPF